ncbi:DNA recombination protein RmuC [Candidatus Bipolaricaulota bacterium]|nr:DNA recombination protein RmuC [Candidatus Bipolaricaulota bacterium]
MFPAYIASWHAANISIASVAFEQDPDLLEYGIQQRILVASPVTLLALLRAAAFG